MKKWLVSLLLLVSIPSMLLAACSSSGKQSVSGNNNGGHSRDQVLNIGLFDEPPTLNPAEVNNVTSIIVLDQIFDGLTRLNPKGEPELAMASDIQVSKDQTKYTFTIRDGAKWTNGDPVTAGDFEYAWKYQIDPNNANTPNAYLFYIIKNAEEAKKGKASLDQVGIKAINDKTLEVQLKYPVPYFTKLIANAYFYPVNEKIAKTNPKWALEAGDNYVTNGPFKMTE